MEDLEREVLSHNFYMGIMLSPERTDRKQDSAYLCLTLPQGSSDLSRAQRIKHGGREQWGGSTSGFNK